MSKKKFVRIFSLSNFIILTLALAICLFSCDKKSTNKAQPDDNYGAPIQTNDGWETAQPSQVMLRSQKLLEMLAYINGIQNHGVHAILIVKDGKLVFEEYFKGYLWDISKPNFQGAFVTYNMDTPHYLASVTKSVTSAVVGIAKDQNGFSDINDKIKIYFPEYSSILIDEKEKITIKHLLTMTSGLAWDESSTSYDDPANDVTQLFMQPDPVKFILMKTLTSTPGAQFHYNSGCTNILSDIVRKTIEQNFLTFADHNLFKPLGITNYQWDLLNPNYVFASGGLYLRPRDLAKIGYVFLNQGQWKGKQIISEEWIHQSITSHIDPQVSWATGYGYQWWIGSFQFDANVYSCFFAAGWGGQYMFVFPQENMIVIFTCGYFFSPTVIDSFRMVQEYILPALIE